MNPREQQKIREKIAELQARGDLFAHKLLQEKQRAVDLEAELARVTQAIETIRESRKRAVIPSVLHRQLSGKENPTCHTAEVRQINLVNKLETRLNNALIRHNEILKENSNVKQKIERIRRKIQNAVNNQTEKSRRLQEIQNALEEVSEKTGSFKDQRDKFESQRINVLNQNKDERQQFSVACLELEEFISSQAELLGKSIVSAANGVLLNAKMIEQDESSRIGTPADDIRLLDLKLQELDHQLSNDKQLLKQTEKKIQMYRDNVDQLKAVSGLKTVEEIVNANVKNDEELFSYFSYIQTVNQEIDSTLEQLTFVEIETDKFTKDQSAKESNRLLIVNSYKERLKEAQMERQKISSVVKEAKDTADCIAQKVRKLFDDLKCNDPIPATSEGDTYQNILQNMKLVERKCTQIIAEYARALTLGRQGRRPSVLMSPKLFERDLSAAATPASAEDEPPSGEMDLSEDDEDSEEGDENGRPLSLDEMRRIAALRINDRGSVVGNRTTEQRLTMKRMTII
jgi:chromosome segregation ATPase